VLLKNALRPAPHWLVWAVMVTHSDRAQAQSSEGLASPAASNADPTHHAEHPLDLASEIIDPTASLLNVNVLYHWSFERYASDEAGAEGDSHAITFRPVIPFPAWGATNVLRLLVEYEVESESGAAGLGAAEIVDVVVVEQSWGRWGPGVVLHLAPPTDAEESAAPLQLGPAFAVVATLDEWTFGVFNQNLFSEDVQLSRWQPVLGYALSPMLSLSIGEPQITWDWGDGKLVELPVGVQLNIVVPILGQPLRLSVNPELNLIDEPSAQKWSMIFGVALPIPK
jgi:hypothetical protein